MYSNLGIDIELLRRQKASCAGMFARATVSCVLRAITFSPRVWSRLRPEMIGGQFVRWRPAGTLENWKVVGEIQIVSGYFAFVGVE